MQESCHTRLRDQCSWLPRETGPLLPARVEAVQGEATRGQVRAPAPVREVDLAAIRGAEATPGAEAVSPAGA